MNQCAIPPLLLKNGERERNMCSLNSVIQLLRHVPSFVQDLPNWQDGSELMSALSSIISNCGSLLPCSALTLRENLARSANRDFNSGAQHDTVELLGYLLDHCPSELFYFDTSVAYQYYRNTTETTLQKHYGPCPTCGELPKKVPSTQKILRLAVPNSASSLNDLLT